MYSIIPHINATQYSQSLINARVICQHTTETHKGLLYSDACIVLLKQLLVLSMFNCMQNLRFSVLISYIERRVSLCLNE